MAGITVVREKRAASDADLVAHFGCVGSRLTGVAMSFDLTVAQMAFLERLPGEPIYATTWTGASSATIICPLESCGDYVKKVLEVGAAEFLNDYLSVNSRSPSAPTR
jgi:hypothetical protein